MFCWVQAAASSELACEHPKPEVHDGPKVDELRGAECHEALPVRDRRAIQPLAQEVACESEK